MKDAFREFMGCLLLGIAAIMFLLLLISIAAIVGDIITKGAIL